LAPLFLREFRGAVEDPMRILQVIHQYLPKHQAGSEIYTHSLSKALKQLGHEVRVFTYEYGGGPDTGEAVWEEYDSIPIYRVYHSPDAWGRFYWIGQAAHSFKDDWVGIRFGDVLREFQPEIVHAQHLHNVSGTVVRQAKQARIPVVMTLHDYWLMCPRINLYDYQKQICTHSYGGWRCGRCMELSSRMGLGAGLSHLLAPLFAYRRQYLRTVIREIDLFISPSNFLRRQLINFGIPARKVITSDNGYDVSRFLGYKRIESPQFRVGYIGSHMEHKGIHLLIAAFRKLAGDAVLKFYGDATVQPAYGRRIREMAQGDPRIQFCGRFENDRIAKVLSEIDVLVIPSLWYENSPLTIHEAFLARVPVVAAGLGGMAEFVQDGANGLHFEFGDSEDLYRKLTLLERDRSRLAALDKFPAVKTIRENAEELVNIYETLERSV
jgi:glycosyltransferase involved in cell wall biosynthesis